MMNIFISTILLLICIAYANAQTNPNHAHTRNNEPQGSQNTNTEQLLNNAMHSKVCRSFQYMVGGISLIRSSTLESSIYQTPTIFDFFHDGNKELIVPTFVRFIDVIEADTGASAPGWPFSSQYTSSHSSALLYDIDSDGQMEMVYTTLDGQIAFLKQNGTIVHYATLKLLPLPIRKFWYEGMDLSSDNEIGNPNRNDNAFVSLTQDLSSTVHSRKPLDINSIRRRIFGPGNMDGSSKKSNLPSVGDGWLSKEARQSMDDFFTPITMRAFIDVEREGESNPFYSPSYEEAWKAMKEKYASKKKGKNSIVFVDPHILSTPIIVDIDQDGRDEIIIAATYFFDREYYANPDNLKKLDTDVDISMYVAGAIVVLDIQTGKVKWISELDLSTDKSKLRGYVYGSPTVADLDSDGNLEVAIGTSKGFIYVFDKNGKPKNGFPIVKGEVQAQVFIDDINQDGNMELCACDFQQTISCYNSIGKEIWTTSLMGSVAQVPTMGDVDADGKLELVFGTNKGYLYAVRAETGTVIKGFPVIASGPIYAPALITDLSDKPRKGHQSLQIVVPSFDGNIYIIDGRTGCTHKIDIGEKSYSQVLVDDFLGTGKLQLIASTMNGNIFTLDTQAFYHPLKTQTEQYHSSNGFSYRYKHHGIHITKGSRDLRDIIGTFFKVAFVITDNRKLPKGSLRHYHVKFTIGRDEVLKEFDYNMPGTYLMTLPVPKKRMRATVSVEMINEHGQIFRDHFVMSFNMGFLRIIKWALVAPLLAMVIGLFVMKDHYKRKMPLPTS